MTRKSGAEIVWLCGGWRMTEFGIETMGEKINITPTHQ
jgi:hypothetical protein